MRRRRPVEGINSRCSHGTFHTSNQFHLVAVLLSLQLHTNRSSNSAAKRIFVGTIHSWASGRQKYRYWGLTEAGKRSAKKLSKFVTIRRKLVEKDPDAEKNWWYIVAKFTLASSQTTMMEQRQVPRHPSAQSVEYNSCACSKPVSPGTDDVQSSSVCHWLQLPWDIFRGLR